VLRTLIALVFLSCFAGSAAAQPLGILRTGDDLSAFLERQHTQGHLDRAFLLNRPLSAPLAVDLLHQLDSRRDLLDPIDRKLLDRHLGRETLAEASRVNRLIPFAYADGRHFYSLHDDDFSIAVDPMLYLTAGRANFADSFDSPEAATTWQNTRGIRLAGSIGTNFFFESRIEENQRRIARPEFHRKTAPRLGRTYFYADRQVHDYWRVAGSIGVRTGPFEIRFGRDHNHWATGVNSLFLSDFAPAYEQLQVRTTLGPFQLTNLFAALTDLSDMPASYPDQTLPRKYTASHLLAVNLSSRVQVHVFESVVFAPDERRGAGFDIAYLNPLVFYRAVELDRGSPDNILIGAGASWIVRPGYRLYGQGLITEFQIDELFAGRGYWANKWGTMGGVEIAPQLPAHLTLNYELTKIRPFTYSHGDPSTGYVHFEDYLGHSAGQNAIDHTLRVRYLPSSRTHASLLLAYTVHGRDTDDRNVGADPRIGYRDDRQDVYGFFTLGGIRQRRTLAELRSGYEFLPGAHIEGHLRFDRLDDDELGRRQFIEPAVALRWGMPFQSVRF
jgi:hypothetical protein